MKLTFIVNGTETKVKIKKTQKLQDAVNKALKQTGNTGRPSSDFQVILNDRTLNLDWAINYQVEMTNKGERIEDKKINIDKTSVIFLCIRSASGGQGLTPID